MKSFFLTFICAAVAFIATRSRASLDRGLGKKADAVEVFSRLGLSSSH